MQNNFFSDKPAQVGRNMFIFSGNWINLYPLQHYRDEKQMENNEQKAPFSPILIMEFIRQTTVARCLTNENPNLETKFRLGKTYYDQIMSFPLQAQLIRLILAYDEATETLSVKTDETLINRFKEQKSLVEIAQKYEAQYAERYQEYVKVID